MGFEAIGWNKVPTIRYYVDGETGESHIHRHGVREEEVAEVLARPGEDRSGREGARVAIGKTRAGRVIRVVYVPDPELDELFVLTAFELQGKPLRAFKRRWRGKRS